MDAAVQGVHTTRRARYLVWGVLLIVSLAALGLWETPGRRGAAALTLRILVKGVPPGTRAVMWVGPRGAWRKSLNGGASVVVRETPAGAVVDSGAVEVPVSFRRGMKIILRRSTSDLAVIRFSAPGGGDRFFVLSLTKDWIAGMLRPGGFMRVDTETDWNGLWSTPDPGSLEP